MHSIPALIHQLAGEHVNHACAGFNISHAIYHMLSVTSYLSDVSCRQLIFDAVLIDLNTCTISA